MNLKVAIVVVVYNKSVNDSLTLSSINKASLGPDIVLVLDNSTKENNNSVLCEESAFAYYSMNGNAGLSKAYNKALDILPKDVDIVVWADDDTDFPSDYFEKLRNHCDVHNDSKVYLPVVLSKSMIISPSFFTSEGVRPFGSVEEIENNKSITAINSGMAVNIGLYKNYRYDEKIFLDYLDHDFMYFCRRNDIKICIMEDVKINQSYFAEENKSKKLLKIRYKIYKKDFKYFCKKWKFGFIKTKLELLRYKWAYFWH